MSPTLYKLGKLRVVIYPKDHNPPHVHVISPGGEAKFEITSLNLISVTGYSQKDIKRIKEFLKHRKEHLLEFWHEYQK